MDKKQNIQKTAEYQIGNTIYSVTPVFGAALQTEDTEEKITRLILQDKKHKGAKPRNFGYSYLQNIQYPYEHSTWVDWLICTELCYEDRGY